MKKHILKVFFGVFVLHLFSILASMPLLADVTKPLLLSILIFFYLKQTLQHSKTLLGALIFSLLGDILLIFQGKNGWFFITGLIAFLTAHIFYIIFFAKKITQNNGIKVKWMWVLLVALYSITFLTLLMPSLGNMKIPVVLYTVVISLMLLTVLHACNSSSISGKWCIAGAILFVISDSILAINKFYSPFPYAGFLIMLTYGMAQFSLVYGITLDTEK